MADSPVTADHIRSWTWKDPILAPVVQFIQQGWPVQCQSGLSPFISRRAKLSLYEGYVLWIHMWLFIHLEKRKCKQNFVKGHPGIA